MEIGEVLETVIDESNPMVQEGVQECTEDERENVKEGE